ncbi:glycosyl transferase, family 51 [Thermosinus carboxydivorans Nor1]|uniref:Glycosyl transferase, family 51 n=1 Tax=Thermosinus carboxydivorans Nor1 TaxID=401526 RepID=A1HQP9_9FIRM|nr:transglycosylase domain-containing protein [Thermosinus carboxydivorans]EAX47610.1 glycosyl transferase, family 51 [Thermosinus carboxydivorans Nor1]
MRTGRFLAFLLLLFLAAFWWAGGSSIVKPYSLSVEKVLAVGHDATGAWDRLYRLVALKSAVEARLDKKRYVKLADIPLPLQQAVIAVEDSRYYRHFGFDIEGILRAALVNLQAGEVREGGSTITQQLVKNLFLSQEQSVGRKLEEIILAVDMELHYSKEEILEMYLNTIYFGAGAYGIQDAARVYFGKEPANLNLAECALLAGLPNAPSVYSPYENLTAAKQRQAVVLAVMVKQGYIGPNQAEEAKRQPLRLVR